MPTIVPDAVFLRGSVDKLGLLVVQSGKSLEVLWEDGSRKTVTSGAPYAKAPFGSVQFLLLALPEVVSSCWSDSQRAAELIALYLSSAKTKIAKAMLKRRAHSELELPRDIPAKDWAAIRKTLEALPGVELSTKTNTFSWSGGTPPDLIPAAVSARWNRLTGLERVPGNTGQDEPVQTSRPTRSTVATSETRTRTRRVIRNIGERTVTRSSRAASAHETASAPAPATQPTPTTSTTTPRRTPAQSVSKPAGAPHDANGVADKTQPRTPGDIFITELLEHARIDDHAAAALAADAREQMRTQLGNRARAVRTALDALDLKSRIAALKALLLVRGALTAEAAGEWAGGSHATDDLESLSYQLRSTPDGAAAQAAAHIALASQALVSHAKSAQKPVWLPEAFAVLAAGYGAGTQAAVTVLGSAMARTVRDTRHLDDPHDILRDAYAKLPLTPGGARTQFLSALSVTTPAPDIDWVSDIGIDDLIGLTDAESLRLCDVVTWNRYFTQLAEAAVRSATTRGRLFMLASKSVVANLVMPDTVTEAIRRIADTDAPLRTWMPSLTHQVERNAMAAELTASRARAEAAEEASRQALAAAHTSRAEAVRLVAMLDEIRDTGQADDDDDALQIERDSLRQAVAAIATIEASAARAGAARVIETIGEELDVLRVRPIGQRGRDAEFDPHLHAVVGRRPAVGTLVRVGRPGYAWEHDNATEILIKARVAPSPTDDLNDTATAQ